MYYKKPARKPAMKSRNATLKAKLDRVFLSIPAYGIPKDTRKTDFSNVSVAEIKPYPRRIVGIISAAHGNEVQRDKLQRAMWFLWQPIQRGYERRVSSGVG